MSRLRKLFRAAAAAAAFFFIAGPVAVMNGHVAMAAPASKLPSIVNWGDSVCLGESAYQGYSAGGPINGLCNGNGDITVERLDPFYKGTPVLVSASVGNARLEIRVSGGKLMPIRPFIRETLTNDPNGALTTRVEAFEPAGGSPVLDASAGRADGSNGAPGVSEYGAWLWYPPAAGGTLEWSVNGAKGKSLHIPAAAPIPNGMAISTAPILRDALTETVALGVNGTTDAGAARAAIRQTGAAGTVTVIAGGGATVKPVGTAGFSLDGRMIRWIDPRPGQSVVIRAVCARCGQAGPYYINAMFKDEWNPVLGIGAVIHEPGRVTDIEPGVSVTLSGPETVSVGQSARYTAQAKGASGGIEWRIDTDARGPLVPHGSTATLRALKPGYVTITAAAHGANGQAAQASLRVRVVSAPARHGGLAPSALLLPLLLILILLLLLLAVRRRRKRAAEGEGQGEGREP
ncbi:MAG: hypothetical protein QJR08_00470 [Bacillota bacterium]|nr:hypothetical protein [Bacillota bacterium]